MAGISIAAASTHIDPANCGSTVSWRVYENYERLNGEVDIADCSHKISWQIDEHEDTFGLEKIDAAIAALMEFRKAFAAAKRARARAKAIAAKK